MDYDYSKKKVELKWSTGDYEFSCVGAWDWFHVYISTKFKSQYVVLIGYLFKRYYLLRFRIIHDLSKLTREIIKIKKNFFLIRNFAAPECPL